MGIPGRLTNSCNTWGTPILNLHFLSGYMWCRILELVWHPSRTQQNLFKNNLTQLWRRLNLWSGKLHLPVAQWPHRPTLVWVRPLPPLLVRVVVVVVVPQATKVVQMLFGSTQASIFCFDPKMKRMTCKTFCATLSCCTILNGFCYIRHETGPLLKFLTLAILYKYPDIIQYVDHFGSWTPALINVSGQSGLVRLGCCSGWSWQPGCCQQIQDDWCQASQTLRGEAVWQMQCAREHSQGMEVRWQSQGWLASSLGENRLRQGECSNKKMWSSNFWKRYVGYWCLWVCFDMYDIPTCMSIILN